MINNPMFTDAEQQALIQGLLLGENLKRGRIDHGVKQEEVDEFLTWCGMVRVMHGMINSVILEQATAQRSPAPAGGMDQFAFRLTTRGEEYVRTELLPSIVAGKPDLVRELDLPALSRLERPLNRRSVYLKTGPPVVNEEAVRVNDEILAEPDVESSRTTIQDAELIVTPPGEGLFQYGTHFAAELGMLLREQLFNPNVREIQVLIDLGEVDHDE